jgi:excinuclease UvrABC ATPase subunit
MNNYLYEVNIIGGIVMKNIAKLILTSIQFLVWFVIIIAAQYITLTTLSLPSGGEVERVQLLEAELTDVIYSDAPGFWSTNIQVLRDAEQPKIVIRG